MAIYRGDGTTGTATILFNTDGDKGDITVTNKGALWTIDNDAVTTSKLGGDITAQGKALLDDATNAQQRTTLGLGTLATQSGTFSGTSSGTNTGDQNLFSTIAIAGQSNIIADTTSDSLTLIAGSNVTLTTDALTDSITISASSGITDGDKGDITVSSTGTVWTIDNGVVTTAKLGGDITTAGKALLDDADASAQRTTLGVAIGTDVQAYDAATAKTNVTQGYTASQYSIPSALAYAATVTPNLTLRDNFTLTLTGNVTLANPSAKNIGQSGAIVITQDATGSRLISYGSEWVAEGGAQALSTTANAVDVLYYFVVSNTKIDYRLRKSV